MRYEILGTVFRIVAEDDSILERLASLLGSFSRTERASRAQDLIQVIGDSDRGYAIFRDCIRHGRELRFEDAVSRLVASLNNVVIERAPLFAVHSGVVSLQGKLVAFPAESGQGKTTLTAAALQAGAEYLSDEALVFDDDGLVLPYPKPLALAPRSTELLGLGQSDGERLMTAEELGSVVGARSRLGHIVISRYGAEELELTPLPRSSAVAKLIELSFNHFKDPARAFRIATEVAREVDVWRLDYDDPKEAIDLLVDRVT